jgi:uncharacterized protein (TIGR02391 family)
MGINHSDKDIQKIKMLYGRLKGISEISLNKYSVSEITGYDYNSIIDQLNALLGEDFNCYKITRFQENYPSGIIVEDKDFNPKIMQLIRALEYGYNLNENIMQIGSIYNSLSDSELRSRCSDILTAPANFDRVINQASLVLEDRIRSKSGIKGESAVTVVTKAINPEPSKSILQISASKEEHEGMHYICKGIMLAFRNPTHHTITDKYKREDALKFCAFIDNLLKVIDESKKI